MANTKSAIKKIRVDARKTANNETTRRAYRTAVKSVTSAVAKGDLKAAKSSLSTAYKQLDKAGKKNVIHYKKADRLKSRLTQAIIKAEKQK